MFKCEFCEEGYSTNFLCQACSDVETKENQAIVTVCNDCCQCDLRVNGSKRWPPLPLVIEENEVPF